MSTRPIRLIALDLDGTTLTSQRELHPDNVSAIGRAREAGIRVVFASGRIIPSMERYAKDAGVPYPIIGANGAHVLGSLGEEVLHQSLVASTVHTVWDYTERFDLHLNHYSRRDLHFRKESEFSALYRERLRLSIGQVSAREVAVGAVATKLMIVDHPDRIPQHRAALEALLKGHACSITESEPEYLEVLPSGCSKARGLAALCDRLGIQQAETAAVGDYLNDLEMLRWVGVSGAVSGADPKILESVDYVSTSNDEGGVARFIDWILLNRRQ